MIAEAGINQVIMHRWHQHLQPGWLDAQAAA
jgi:hypothetical protein